MNLVVQYLRAHKSKAIVAAAVVLGLVLGFWLVPRAPHAGEETSRLPEVRLLGEALPLDEAAGNKALVRVRRYAAGSIALALPDGKRRDYYVGRLGGEIDRVRLAQLVRDARDRTSPLYRTWHENGGQAQLELPVPVVLNRERALSELLLLKDELDRLPVDARLDLEKRKLLPEVNGRLLDVDGTLTAIERALEHGERKAELIFEFRKPKRVASELGNVAFDEVLGYFETNYNRSMRYQARTFNLRLAASKLDGYVLLPGETFDFNEVVGPRDEANGYKVAPVIAEGELVDGIGGGTCQISGTLHGAAFFAGLRIAERYPHTRPSSYIKMGLDATVVYPTINFRLRNAYGFPVVLHQVVRNGVVRAEILGPRRTRTVTLIRKIDQAIPYDELERPDKDLPNGVRVLGQRGIAGFRIHRYRIVREGEHALRERWNDTYPPTTQIIRVGTGDMKPDETRTEDDPHPEYVADELLVMTQGPDVERNEPGEPSNRGGPSQEWREPGKYGEYGWTERDGMPFWRDREGKADPRGQRDGEGKTAATTSTDPKP
ncbi:MAG TPA: VanW family protein [Polyangiaceae bacterium]|nr:VanW family protein [Polyangiaceae bacterium]